MKCLITGCNGFMGVHLAEFLCSLGISVLGTVHSDAANIRHLELERKITLFPCDISEPRTVSEVVERVRPDWLFHMAAQSLPSRAWRDPEGTVRVNLLGSLHLLEAVRKAGLDCRIIMLGTSDEYGSLQTGNRRITEDTPLMPSSPYGVSKVAADLLSSVYCRAYGMNIIGVRPFFIVGPGRANNALAEFARRIAEIEEGQADILAVGNLDSVRDIVDVRDAVKALWILADKGSNCEVYNLCSGIGQKISCLLDDLVRLSGSRIPVNVDPQKFRPLDAPALIGDNTKLKNLGWEPEISFERTLLDVLVFWRNVVKGGIRV